MRGRDRGFDLSASPQPRLLSGWGRYPKACCAVLEPHSYADAHEAMAVLPSAIARGNGRSYGDSSLNPEGVVATRRLAHILAFHEATGSIVCESGVLLSDIIDVILPRGWFPPVTPGTRHVTVGGMIASDVHGKNHHRAGSFCDHLLWIDLALPDGRMLHCSPHEEPELFSATCGGMGLTGIVLRAAFRLLAVETARIRQRTIRTPTLDAAFEAFEAARGSTYSVAWIDGLAVGGDLGRSVVFLGEHARLEELRATHSGDPFARRASRLTRVPIDLPEFAMSRTPVRLFNQVYYHAQRAGDSLRDLNSYFYPLDALLDWNRVYGRRGFLQYQCVLPLAESLPGMRRLLREIAKTGDPSFVGVLKRMGPQSFGLLSFPMEGYTLAMDFPASTDSLSLLTRLDAITNEHRGRIYLAKDSRCDPRMMAAGYPRLSDFRAVRQRFGLAGRVESLQSRRLEI